MKPKKLAPAAPKPAPKKLAFWDEDDDVIELPGTATAEQAIAANKKVRGFITLAPAPQPAAATKQPPSKPAKNVPPAPARPSAIPLEGVSIVFCGESPVMIMSGANATWTDLMCWSLSLQTTMHLHRADLEPKHAVDDTISCLQKHVKILPRK